MTPLSRHTRYDRRMKQIPLIAFVTLVASAATAEPPEIVDATATQTGTSWRVDVTLRHPDTGWAHYADGWDVRDEAGTRLGHRVLHHPHVDEQPFTRALVDLDLQDVTGDIFVRAHCSVDGWTTDTVRIDIQP